jgi:hypothetical protein
MAQSDWLHADGAGFSRITHRQYAIFIALSTKQSQKTLKFNEILFIVKMSGEVYCEIEFYYPEVEIKMNDTKLYFVSLMKYSIMIIWFIRACRL